MRAALAATLLALPCVLVPHAVLAQGYPRTPAEYLKLMDADGDGRISEQEYVDYLSAGFRRMDTNGDGVLEPEELPGGHGKPITLRSHQDNLRRQFHKLDRNHDGYLNAKELAAPPA